MVRYIDSEKMEGEHVGGSIYGRTFVTISSDKTPLTSIMNDDPASLAYIYSS